VADVEHVQEILIIEREDIAQARRFAAAHGVDVEEVDVRGIEPVWTVTLLLLGAPAAVATVVHLLENAKGGQVIDLRPGASATFYRSKDLVYGLVVVLGTDGKVTVEVKEPEGCLVQLWTLSRILSLTMARPGLSKWDGNRSERSVEPLMLTSNRQLFERL
jgi:hypothetical protein